MSRGKNTRGFTIVELLTVMSIIIILMSILVPALSRVRRYAKVVTQKGQFADISKGLELYRNEHQGQYPDSGPSSADSIGATIGYCGAMKLCEALLGQDAMGFHPLSRFTADGIIVDEANGISHNLYPFDLCNQITPDMVTYAPLVPNLQERDKYVDVENFKSYRLRQIYLAAWTFTALGVSYYDTPVAFSEGLNYRNAVIGDVFQKATIQSGAVTIGCTPKAGQKVGMPILYFKADSSKMNHDAITALNPAVANTNIYNFDDNYAISALGCPWETTYITEHPMRTDPRIFLKEITNAKITSTTKPHNEDTYILMSAGWDGLYGTRDDVFNFSD